MIRVVLAVVLATALFGVSLPIAERAERDRNTALATGELERIGDRAERLAARNDPVAAEEEPAATTLVVTAPTPTFTEGGLLTIADDRLVWQPHAGGNRTVETDVRLRVGVPLIVTDRARVRLSLVGTASDPVVHVEQPRVETQSRGQG